MARKQELVQDIKEGRESLSVESNLIVTNLHGESIDSFAWLYDQKFRREPDTISRAFESFHDITVTLSVVFSSIEFQGSALRYIGFPHRLAPDGGGSHKFSAGWHCVSVSVARGMAFTQHPVNAAVEILKYSSIGRRSQFFLFRRREHPRNIYSSHGKIHRVVI